LSLYVYNYTKNFAIIGADTRLCGLKDNSYYKIHDNACKIINKHNKVFTFGGDYFATNILIDLINKSDYDYAELYNICNQLDNEYNIDKDIYFIELTWVAYENNSYVLYNIATYNKYKIIRSIPEDNYMSNFFGGIETEKAIDYYNKNINNLNLIDLYKDIYNFCSNEYIGGDLILYILKDGKSIKTYKYNISEKCYKIVGNSGKFNKIEMYNPTTNLLDVEVGNYIGQDGLSKRGIKISNGSFEISKAAGISNGIELNPTNGLTITRSDNKFRGTFNATDLNFETSSDNGNTWSKRFYYDSTAQKLVVNGIIDAQDFKINGTSILGDNKILSNYIETLVVGSNVIMGANATISWSQITSKPTIPTLPSYITSTKITSTTIESPSITGGTITGGSITSNSTINVTTDLRVGDNIYVGNENTLLEKSLVFYNGGNMTGIGLVSNGDFRVDGDKNLALTAYEGSVQMTAMGSTGSVYVTASQNMDIYAVGDILLSSNSYCHIDGNLKHTGSDIGFFGKAPTFQQTAELLGDKLTTESADLTYGSTEVSMLTHLKSDVGNLYNKVNGILNKLAEYGLFSVS